MMSQYAGPQSVTNHLTSIKNFPRPVAHTLLHLAIHSHPYNEISSYGLCDNLNFGSVDLRIVRSSVAVADSLAVYNTG
jgi:hypothetical protein